MSYFLLDAAQLQVRLENAKELAKADNFRCLYKGNLADQLSNVAPYLFVSSPPDFVDWLFTEGWGNSWGVFVLTRELPTVVYEHFRKFLIVKNTNGKSLYFRYYDPRVLRQFLQNCTESELIAFFGPVRYFLVEDVNTEYGISFWLDNGKLRSVRHPKLEAKQNYFNYLKQFL